MDTTPVLGPAQHVLDLVSLVVERGMVRDRHLALTGCRGLARAFPGRFGTSRRRRLWLLDVFRGVGIPRGPRYRGRRYSRLISRTRYARRCRTVRPHRLGMFAVVLLCGMGVSLLAES